MRKLLAIALATLFSGCLNIYTRCPGTDAKIKDTYQCTEESAELSFVVMFPQIMSTTGDNGFQAWNIVSVPIGCLCFVDVACEGILDTLFWPVDAAIVSKRQALGTGREAWER